MTDYWSHALVLRSFDDCFLTLRLHEGTKAVHVLCSRLCMMLGLTWKVSHALQPPREGDPFLKWSTQQTRERSTDNSTVPVTFKIEPPTLKEHEHFLRPQ